MINFSTNDHLINTSGNKLSFDAIDKDHDLSPAGLFQLLPTECIYHILSFLSRKQLPLFEQLTQLTSSGFYTHHQWKVICQQKEFNFDWTDLKNYHPGKQDKIRYFMGQGLCDYISSRTSFICRRMDLPAKSEEQSQAFTQHYHHFSSLHRFPSLKAYIFQDLKTQAEMEKEKFPLTEPPEPSLPEELKAGDQLLKGLYHLGRASRISIVTKNQERDIFIPGREKEFYEAKEKLTCSIQNGVTLASLLAIRLTSGIKNMLSPAKSLELADLSIKDREKKDYRGLHEFVSSIINSEGLFEALFSKHRGLPPFLEFHAIALYKQNEWEEADKYFQEAIAAYGSSILPQTWEHYFDFKCLEMNKKQHSDSLLSHSSYQQDKQTAIETINRAIIAYGENVPPTTLLKKDFLCENLQTEEYAKELIQNSSYYQKEELRKMWLDKYVNDSSNHSHRYLDYALLTYGKNEAPTRLLFTQVYQESQKGYKERAEELFKNTLVIYKEKQETPSFEALFVAAEIHSTVAYEYEKKSLFLDSLHLLKKAKSFLDRAHSILIQENREDYFGNKIGRQRILKEIENLDQLISLEIDGKEEEIKNEDCLNDPNQPLPPLEDPFNAEEFLNLSF